ncbi:AMP-binding protein [Algoriphagus sp. AGSA1]|uniref:AMP-binding protein n=1 Tax=Algoriphagus sp. AGSA1 TaxID=2907213 RepID=UPI001F38D7C1|nr:AMP-binding protein [Algoriphagus sp. AGSA1]MCE7057002.1 AMP-binding protein [Algoriphagus sp. AGSA1]
MNSNKKMFQLTFGKYKFQNLTDLGLDIADFPYYAQAAMEFCGSWLSGSTSFVQQTSGSTGTPKEIEISRAQMIASAKGTQSFFRTDEGSTLLCCLDPRYIAGKMMLVRAMVWNSPIHLAEPKSNPLGGLRVLADFVAMVPLQVETCLADKSSLKKLKAIDHLIIGGAPISSALKEKLLENDIQAYQTYGMTETVSHIALAKITSGELIYSFLPDVEFGLDGRSALWITSASSNYKKVQTNDLVELVDNSSFRWLGRADFVVNSGGVKLHPELLESKSEATIYSFFPTSSFFFFGKKDDRLGEKLCLAIESNHGSEKTENLLFELKKVLTRFEIPKNIFIIQAFARTESGKINRLKTIENLGN